MKILHLSTSDTNGGAARAAYRLHTGLRRLGHDSTMLVAKKSSDDASVITQKYYDDGFFHRLKRKKNRKQIGADVEKWLTHRPKGYELFSDDRTDGGFDLAKQLEELPKFDVINLHWVAGFFDYRCFYSPVMRNTPLVWRFADMGPLTGGCHYDCGCGKFTAQCGACPQLGSKVEDDYSRQIWTRKNEALSSLPPGWLNLVGTSRWIGGEAKRSSLYGKFPVTIIPNGLDTTDFAPRDRNAARDAFGILHNAKVVLFLAESSNIHRKGFHLLAEALKGMAGVEGLVLLSVGGGKPVVPGVTSIHLGKIGNDRLLSIVYSAADVFVIPSIQESFGQTVTESMACGTPVVGFNTGGIPDMVRPGITGYLAKVEDVGELREAVLKVLLDPAKRAEMSRQCREIAEAEYTLNVQATAYSALYERITQSGHGQLS